MNRQELSRHKKRQVLAHINKHGNTPASELVSKYGCSKAMAYECLRLCGIEVLSMADVRKRVGEHKLKGIADYLVKYGSMSVDEMANKFNCGRNMAIRALDMAKMQPKESRDTGGNITIDSTMYRPNGRNLLTEAWV